MGTINHIRVARFNPAIARECEEGHLRRREGHAYGSPTPVTVDPYTRRSNICPVCHIALAIGRGEVEGRCLC